MKLTGKPRITTADAAGTVAALVKNESWTGTGLISHEL